MFPKKMLYEFVSPIRASWSVLNSTTLIGDASSVSGLGVWITTSSSFLGSTAQLRPWPPPQNPAEFLGGFSTIFFFTG
jgi:hypothetical protein